MPAFGGDALLFQKVRPSEQHFRVNMAQMGTMVLHQTITRNSTGGLNADATITMGMMGMTMEMAMHNELDPNGVFQLATMRVDNQGVSAGVTATMNGTTLVVVEEKPGPTGAIEKKTQSIENVPNDAIVSDLIEFTLEHTTDGQKLTVLNLNEARIETWSIHHLGRKSTTLGDNDVMADCYEIRRGAAGKTTYYMKNGAVVRFEDPANGVVGIAISAEQAAKEIEQIRSANNMDMEAIEAMMKEAMKEGLEQAVEEMEAQENK